MKRWTAALVLVPAVAFHVAAQEPAGRDFRQAENQFDRLCEGCHGEGGAVPNAAVSKMFGVPIPMLNSPEIQAKSDADIRKAITEGKGKMPKTTVTGPSVDDVIAYVRSLKK